MLRRRSKDAEVVDVNVVGLSRIRIALNVSTVTIFLVVTAVHRRRVRLFGLGRGSPLILLGVEWKPSPASPRSRSGR